MKLVSCVGLIVAQLACGGSVAFAGGSVAFASNADLQEAVRGQLVVIDASGQFAQSTELQHSSKMGFMISDDGFVLTTYSLLTFLGKVEPESITISVAPAAPTRPTGNIPAVIYSEDLRHNLLLLRVNAKELKRSNHLDLGDSAAFAGGSLFTLSYDSNNTLAQFEGTHTSQNFAKGSWQTEFDGLDERGGGAPVYSSGGKIVGVVREKKDGKNYVIPIELARPLLLPLSVAGDEEKLGEIEKHINWFVIPANSDDAKVRLRLCYDKFFPTELTPKTARIKVTLSSPNDPTRSPITRPEVVAEPIPVQLAAWGLNCDAYYDLSEDGKVADAMKTLWKTVNISVDFIVTLSDGSTLTQHAYLQE